MFQCCPSTLLLANAGSGAAGRAAARGTPEAQVLAAVAARQVAQHIVVVVPAFDRNKVKLLKTGTTRKCTADHPPVPQRQRAFAAHTACTPTQADGTLQATPASLSGAQCKVGGAPFFGALLPSTSKQPSHPATQPHPASLDDAQDEVGGAHALGALRLLEPPQLLDKAVHIVCGGGGRCGRTAYDVSSVGDCRFMLPAQRLHNAWIAEQPEAPAYSTRCCTAATAAPAALTRLPAGVCVWQGVVRHKVDVVLVQELLGDDPGRVGHHLVHPPAAD